MIDIKLSGLAEALSLEFSGDDFTINNISTDSRTIKKGDLFIAIVGDKFNGHDYIQEAINNGAGALLINKDIYSTTQNFPIPVLRVANSVYALGKLANIHKNKYAAKVIAVTGSCGKTTTRQMLGSILSQSYKVLTSEKNFNNEIGLAKTLLEITDEYEYVVVEMGATKKGDITYLTKLARPDMGVITNAGPVHLELMGNIDNVAKTKGELFCDLDADALAIINVDDVYAPYWLSSLVKQNVITFGMERTADITCTSFLEKPDGTEIEVMTDVGTVKTTLSVLGRHNILNALAAVACARGYDVPMEDIQQGLAEFKAVAGRLQVMNGFKGSCILDDTYNANPLSMQYSLSVLGNREVEKRILVMGDMLELGEDAEILHEEVGKAASLMKIDYLLAIGELSQSVIKGFSGNGKHFSNKVDLVSYLKQILDKDTAVLVKGSNSMGMDEIVHSIV